MASRRNIRSARSFTGTRHEHHRLRRVRRAGAGHRRPDPRFRNVLDQEERPSGQDRLDLAGSRGRGPRGRSRQAPHLARPQADAATIRGKPSPQNHPAGTIVEGEVKNKTEFGLFIGLEGDVDGMVHLSDLDWNRPGEQAIEEYKKGDIVQAQVLDVDIEKERISLGIKQLGSDPIGEAAASGDLRKGAVVTCEVIDVKDGGIEVKIVDTDLAAFIRRSELSRDRDEQRPERFAVGEKVDARVTNFDKKTRKVTLSIKALEIAEEKEAVAQYGSTDSGASLGDILGAALKKQEEKISPSSGFRESKAREPPGPRAFHLRGTLRFPSGSAAADAFAGLEPATARPPGASGPQLWAKMSVSSQPSRSSLARVAGSGSRPRRAVAPVPRQPIGRAVPRAHADAARRRRHRRAARRSVPRPPSRRTAAASKSMPSSSFTRSFSPCRSV